MTALIWDLDGTLVDSYRAIVPAAQEACAAFGLDFDTDYIHAEVIRTSVGDFIESAAGAKNAAAIKDRFNLLNDSRINAILPMPHVKEALDLLSEDGNSSFVFTHRGASCRTILENTGLLPYFTEVVTALDGFPRKPAPDAILYLMDKYVLSPKDCYYVGDRSLDVEAANNAGIGSILYLDPASPGTATGKETYVVKDLLEIPDICREKKQNSPS